MLRQEPPCSQGPESCGAGRREELGPQGPGWDGHKAYLWQVRLYWGRPVSLR